jgi:hypothetical protein
VVNFVKFKSFFNKARHNIKYNILHNCFECNECSNLRTKKVKWPIWCAMEGVCNPIDNEQGWTWMSGYPNYPNSYSVKTSIWIFVFIFVFNGSVKWMYSYSFFYFLPIWFHIRIRQKCGLSDTIYICVELSSEKAIQNLFSWLINIYKMMLI